MKCLVCSKYVYYGLERCNFCGYKLGAKKWVFKLSKDLIREVT